MTEWKEYKLSDIGTIVGGATPSTKDSDNYDDGEIAWLTPKDLSTFSERYISRGERNITEKGFKSSSTKMLPTNTILFSSRAPIGYVAIAANEMCTNQGFKSIIPNSKVNYMFLYYLLKYKKAAIEGMGSGTTFKEVSGNVMKNIEVCIPTDLNVQKKIADVLNAIDSKIENNAAINRNLNDQIKTVFSNTFPSISTDGGNTLDEIIDFSNGKKRPDSEGGIPVYGGNGILSYTDKTNAENCVVVGRVGAYCGSLYLSVAPCWISDNAIKAKAKAKDSSSQLFIFYLLQVLGLSNRHIGTSQPLLTQGILNAIPFSKPDSDKVFEFCDYADLIQKQIDQNNKVISELEQLRDLLLPKLMSGALDVSEIDL